MFIMNHAYLLKSSDYKKNATLLQNQIFIIHFGFIILCHPMILCQALMYLDQKTFIIHLPRCLRKTVDDTFFSRSHLVTKRAPHYNILWSKKSQTSFRILCAILCQTLTQIIKCLSSIFHVLQRSLIWPGQATCWHSQACRSADKSEWQCGSVHVGHILEYEHQSLVGLPSIKARINRPSRALTSTRQASLLLSSASLLLHHKHNRTFSRDFISQEFSHY